MQKLFRILALILIIGQPLLASDTSQQPHIKPKGHVEGETFIHNRGFRFQIPEDYEVNTEPGGASMLLQKIMPKKARFRPYLTTSIFSGPTFIDTETPTDEKAVMNGQKIQKFYQAQLPGTSVNYEIVAETLVEFPNSRSVLLVYTEFSLSSGKMSQAHIIMANETQTFVTTFTDMKSTFDSNLDIVYSAMVEMKIEGKTLVRPSLIMTVLKYGALPFIVFIIWLVTIMRNDDDIGASTGADRPIQPLPTNSELDSITSSSEFDNNHFDQTSPPPQSPLSTSTTHQDSVLGQEDSSFDRDETVNSSKLDSDDDGVTDYF